MKSMLATVSPKEDFIEENALGLPISGRRGPQLAGRQTSARWHEQGEMRTSGHRQPRYDNIATGMTNMMATVGWKEDLVEMNALGLPITGGVGDNLLDVKPISASRNKTVGDTTSYKQPHYDGFANGWMSILVLVGWRADLVERHTLMPPTSFASCDQDGR